MFLSYCFFQIDKQLASGEYFIQEKERKLKAWQGKKVILVPRWVVLTKAYHTKRHLFALYSPVLCWLKKVIAVSQRRLSHHSRHSRMGSESQLLYCRRRLTFEGLLEISNGRYLTRGEPGLFSFQICFQKS